MNATNPILPSFEPNLSSPAISSNISTQNNTSNQDWDKSAKKVGTVAQKVKAGAMIAATGTFRAIKFVVTFEFVRKPTNIFLKHIYPDRKSHSAERRVLIDAYKGAVKKRFERFDLYRPTSKGEDEPVPDELSNF